MVWQTGFCGYIVRLFFRDHCKNPFYFEVGIFSVHFTVSALLVPAIPVGVFIGRWLNARMSDRIFYDISHASGDGWKIDFCQRKLAASYYDGYFQSCAGGVRGPSRWV